MRNHLYLLVLISHGRAHRPVGFIVEIFLTEEQKKDIIYSEGETPLLRQVEQALSQRENLPGPVGRKVSVATMGLGDPALNESLGELFRKMPAKDQHHYRVILAQEREKTFALVEQ